MGYTHYWRQDRGPATTEQWLAITNAFRTLLSHSPVPVQREDDDNGPPMITDQHIAFNGIGGAGHETMWMGKNAPGFNFCKTARKPYDLLVTALLILADHHAPGVWDITSDGEVENWQPALDLVNGKLPDQYALPEGVRP